MRKSIALVLFFLLSLPLQQGMARSYSHGTYYRSYSEALCATGMYRCIRVRGNQSWQSMWPRNAQRDLVQRLNRINTRLKPGMVIAVPRSFWGANVMSISPMSQYIGPQNRDTIVVEPSKLAWGAYDTSGRLVHWGPASLGSDYCSDIHSRCHSPTGHFTVYAKQGAGCISKKFPVGRGGAHMPYCMFFHGGYALHGSYEVPGYNASHGCVRMFPQDAQWLNQRFISLGGTKVIIRSYNSSTVSM